MTNLNQFSPFYGNELFVKTKSKNIKVTYFNGELTKTIGTSQKIVDNYFVYEINATDNGYYIISNGSSSKIYVKGPVPYYLFVLSKNNNTTLKEINLEITDTQERKQEITAKHLIHNIYVLNMENIDYLGFVSIKGRDTILATVSKNRFRKLISFVGNSASNISCSTVNETHIKKSNISTNINQTHIETETINRAEKKCV